MPPKSEKPHRRVQLHASCTVVLRTAKERQQKERELVGGHACVSLLGIQGVPLKVIRGIVGHSDIRLTQTVYQHVYQEAKTEAAANMDSTHRGRNAIQKARRCQRPCVCCELRM